jgi:translation elongation factor EF-1alpha
MATKKPAKKTTKKPAAKKPVKKPAKKAAPKKKAPAKKKPAVKKAATPKAPKPIGRVTHYFDHLKVAVISLEKGKSLKVGDTIRIEGGEIDFTQPIKSLQIEHEEVKSVKAGDDFGTKVKKLVREGYRVHKA